jgi:hypothetical protein
VHRFRGGRGSGHDDVDPDVTVGELVGPMSVRLLFLVFGTGLIADALVNHSALW